MRPTAADHSLWIAIGHASSLAPQSHANVSNLQIAACQDLLLRALDVGANPDAEFSLPTPQGESVRLTCMERAFGQLHGAFLVPLLEKAVEQGWRADRLPSGLWVTGQEAFDSRHRPPRPTTWRLASDVLSKEPGWIQMVAQGSPWGSGQSAKIGSLLLAAGAPLARPGAARREAENETEAMLAYGELRDPLYLAVMRGGNLSVARMLVEAGALEGFSATAIDGLGREIRFCWPEDDQEAISLVTMLQSHMQAVSLEGEASSVPERHRPRRTL